MNKKLKNLLKQIIVAAIFFIAAFFPFPEFVRLTFFAMSYIIAGWSVINKARRNIAQGQVFDENFLMVIATFGAIYLKEYSEAVAVMLFFQIGEFFQSYAVNQSRKSIAALMDIRPDYAQVKRNGEIVTVSPDDVRMGEVIVVRPGERIPLDGEVLVGESVVDTSALTGESVPQEVTQGCPVTSGCINLTGVLEVTVTKEFSESTVSKILNLVENAGSRKAGMENYITRFARYYTPVVVIVALLLAVFPPLLMDGATFDEWIYRAITFLVISCPCALVISVPLSFFGGLGAASRCGILIKGSNYLEALSRVETVVFDKTGTLTTGCFRVVEILPSGITEKRLLEVAAYVEAYSKHPIGEAIKSAWEQPLDLSRVTEVKEIFGEGICCRFDGVEVCAGNIKLLRRLGISIEEISASGTVVYVVISGEYAGYLLIEDEVKKDSALAVDALRKYDVRKLVMLTGDRKGVAQAVSEKLGLDAFYSELLPDGKVEKLDSLLLEKMVGKNILFVGDGINDAPVLALADIGVAMGGIGSDAAIEAADVVIMTDELSKIVSAIRISKKTLTIVRENIVFAIGVKLAVLVLGAMGFVSIWAAVFADVGVSVIAILNAVRALTFKGKC